jgi:hypothetical protein
VAVITVSDVVYGMPRQITRNSRPTAIEGVTYDVRFIFDAASRKIQYDGVGNARATDQLSAADNAITTYYALVDTEANATVDTTNFELVGIPRFEPIPTPPA